MLGECRGLFFFTTRTRGARGFHEGFCAFLRNFCAWRLPLWGGKHFFTTKFTQLTIRPLSLSAISAPSAPSAGNKPSFRFFCVYFRAFRVKHPLSAISAKFPRHLRETNLNSKSPSAYKPARYCTARRT